MSGKEIEKSAHKGAQRAVRQELEDFTISQKKHQKVVEAKAEVRRIKQEFMIKEEIKAEEEKLEKRDVFSTATEKMAETFDKSEKKRNEQKAIDKALENTEAVLKASDTENHEIQKNVKEGTQKISKELERANEKLEDAKKEKAIKQAADDAIKSVEAKVSKAADKAEEVAKEAKEIAVEAKKEAEAPHSLIIRM